MKYKKKLKNITFFYLQKILIKQLKFCLKLTKKNKRNFPLL